MQFDSLGGATCVWLSFLWPVIYVCAVMFIFHVIYVSTESCVEESRHVGRQHLCYVQGKDSLSTISSFIVILIIIVIIIIIIIFLFVLFIVQCSCSLDWTTHCCCILFSKIRNYFLYCGHLSSLYSAVTSCFVFRALVRHHEGHLPCKEQNSLATAVSEGSLRRPLSALVSPQKLGRLTNNHEQPKMIITSASTASISGHITGLKPGLHYPSWRPELTGDRFPLSVNTGRVDGRAFPLAELTGRVTARQLG